jgi:DnaJ-class molecular chaperone
MRVNYYTILGVSKDATFPEIKKAYKKKVRALHPDVSTSNHDQNKKEQLQQVIDGYKVLSDKEERKKHDIDLILAESLNVIEKDITEEYYLVKIPKSELKLNGWKGEGSFKLNVTCDKCNGYGIRFFRKCKKCSGKGTVLRLINFNIDLRRKSGS